MEPDIPSKLDITKDGALGLSASDVAAELDGALVRVGNRDRGTICILSARILQVF